MERYDHEDEREVVAQVCALLATGPTLQEVRDYFGFTSPRATRRRLAHGWSVTVALMPARPQDAHILLVSPSRRRVWLRVRVEGERVQGVAP